jgi:hypothetical protein
MNRKISILILIMFTSIFCFAGGMKGPLFNDEDILHMWLIAIGIHILAFVGYYCKARWLKIICGILYLPLFLVATVAGLLNPQVLVILIFMGIFYNYVIIKRRSSEALENKMPLNDE